MRTKFKSGDNARGRVGGNAGTCELPLAGNDLNLFESVGRFLRIKCRSVRELSDSEFLALFDIPLSLIHI